nr:hypothetical protein [Tanacetum cinerariifolium]
MPLMSHYICNTTTLTGWGVTRSVPAKVTRSVPAKVTRSVPAGFTRSVPTGFTRSVPAEVTRSVPARFTRSVHAEITRSRKSIAQNHVHKPKLKIPTLDLDAPAQAFLKVIVDEDSDDVDSVNEAWSVVVGWEILSTPLGDINALYRIDGTTKRGKGSSIWQNQHLWKIQSWRLYTLSNVHILETMPGEVLSMFIDVTYPLSVKLIKKMLMQKLELDSHIVGNDLTTAKQLILFLKNQILAAQASSV